MTSEAFSYGDLALIIDSKGRRYSFKLTEGGEFQNHVGQLAHSELIGLDPGTKVKSNAGQTFRALRPTYTDYVVNMPRGAQIIYPKDTAAMIMAADIFPGATVFESGVGSGSMSIALLRAGATVHGLDIREDFAQNARTNVQEFLGPDCIENYRVSIGDAYSGEFSGTFDRAILDLPEPWLVLPHLAKCLKSGGIVVSYSPSITQVIEFTENASKAGFSETEVTEVLHRTWHVDGRAVRPDHRMVAHTAFLCRTIMYYD